MLAIMRTARCLRSRPDSGRARYPRRSPSCPKAIFCSWPAVASSPTPVARAPACRACGRPGKRRAQGSRWPKPRSTRRNCAMPLLSSAADTPRGAEDAAPPKLAFYGDDFTGASDTVATLAQAGLRAILFCGVPTPQQFRRAGALDAFGIAGAARSMPPDAMRAELCTVGPFLTASGARVLHYKCCSTFDSAPHIGSIGVAVETLRAFVPEQPVLIVGGQPSLGRYCLFGELFAVAQRGGAV